MRRVLGFWLLVVPFFVAPALAAALYWSRNVPVGAGVAVLGAVAAVFVSRWTARVAIPIWALRFAIALAVPAWAATFALGALSYMIVAIDRHVTYGTDYCWEPATFVSRKACRGKDHSLLQGRLRYAEATGVPDAAACRRILAGNTPVPCDRDVPFRPVACPVRYAEGWRCYGCERFAATGDMYRTWNFFRADCSEAAAWISVNVTEEEMPKRLDSIR